MNYILHTSNILLHTSSYKQPTQFIFDTDDLNISFSKPMEPKYSITSNTALISGSDFLLIFLINFYLMRIGVLKLCTSRLLARLQGLMFTGKLPCCMASWTVYLL
jgi:hypothetical protein